MEKVGFTRSRAFLYASGKRVPDLSLALQIYRATGHQLGPLKGAEPRQVRALMDLPSADRAA